MTPAMTSWRHGTPTRQCGSSGDEKIDILLTDVQMPGKMDGVDLVTKARHTHANIPVVIISAYIHRVMEPDQGNGPAPLLVSKPYSLQRVVNQVQELAGSLP